MNKILLIALFALVTVTVQAGALSGYPITTTISNADLLPVSSANGDGTYTTHNIGPNTLSGWLANVNGLKSFPTAGTVQSNSVKNGTAVIVDVGAGTNGIVRNFQIIYPTIYVGNGGSPDPVNLDEDFYIQIYNNCGNMNPMTPDDTKLVANIPLATLLSSRYASGDRKAVYSSPYFYAEWQDTGIDLNTIAINIPFAFSNGCVVVLWCTNPDFGVGLANPVWCQSMFETTTTAIPAYENYMLVSSLGTSWGITTNNPNTLNNQFLGLPPGSHGSLIGVFASFDASFITNSLWMENYWKFNLNGVPKFTTSGTEDFFGNPYYFGLGPTVGPMPTYGMMGTVTDSNPMNDGNTQVEAWRVFGAGDNMFFTNGATALAPTSSSSWPLLPNEILREDVLCLAYSDTVPPTNYLGYLAGTNFNTLTTNTVYPGMPTPADGSINVSKNGLGNPTLKVNVSALTDVVLNGPTNATIPASTTIIKAWANFTNASGGVFKLPLYQ